MPNTPKDDEAKFKEALKRMLNTPQKPHKPKPTPPGKAKGNADEQKKR